MTHPDGRNNGDLTPPEGQSPPHLTQAQDRFIATWGKMGSAWGISRTMAEVHALLFIVADPLCTDDVMARLEISRGNASMSLRALEDWGVIRRIHKRGDRKEYFEAETDVVAMFKTIARERKKRELDPLVASLYEIRDLTGVEPAAEADATTAAHNQRLDDMLRFIHALDSLAEALLGPDSKGLPDVLTMLERDA